MRDHEARASLRPARDRNTVSQPRASRLIKSNRNWAQILHGLQCCMPMSHVRNHKVRYVIGDAQVIARGAGALHLFFAEKYACLQW